MAGCARRLKKSAIQTKKCGTGKQGQVAAWDNILVTVLDVLGLVMVVPEDDLRERGKGMKGMMLWLVMTCWEV